jgi:hypothetical protein
MHPVIFATTFARMQIQAIRETLGSVDRVRPFLGNV